jgi:hypothetical protein
MEVIMVAMEVVVLQDLEDGETAAEAAFPGVVPQEVGKGYSIIGSLVLLLALGAGYN